MDEMLLVFHGPTSAVQSHSLSVPSHYTVASLRTGLVTIERQSSTQALLGFVTCKHKVNSPNLFVKQYIWHNPYS